MNYLLDSNLIIAYLRETQKKSTLFEKVLQSVNQLCISVLTCFEILRLMKPHEEEKTGAALQSLRYLDITLPIVDQAIRYAKEYQRVNQGIDVVDYLLAATAKHHHLPLLTYNLKHFPMNDIEVLWRDFEIA